MRKKPGDKGEDPLLKAVRAFLQTPIDALQRAELKKISRSVEGNWLRRFLPKTSGALTYASILSIARKRLEKEREELEFQEVHEKNDLRLEIIHQKLNAIKNLAVLTEVLKQLDAAGPHFADPDDPRQQYARVTRSEQDDDVRTLRGGQSRERGSSPSGIVILHDAAQLFTPPWDVMKTVLDTMAGNLAPVVTLANQHKGFRSR